MDEHDGTATMCMFRFFATGDERVTSHPVDRFIVVLHTHQFTNRYIILYIRTEGAFDLSNSSTEVS